MQGIADWPTRSSIMMIALVSMTTGAAVQTEVFSNLMRQLSTLSVLNHSLQQPSFQLRSSLPTQQLPPTGLSARSQLASADAMIPSTSRPTETSVSLNSIAKRTVSVRPHASSARVRATPTSPSRKVSTNLTLATATLSAPMTCLTLTRTAIASS